MSARSLRLAARSLFRSSGYATAATLTLALGIGLSTAVFTVADALLLRRLPVGGQDRLVVLWGETPDGRFANFPLAMKDVRDFERRTRSLREVAFFEFRGATSTPIRTDDGASTVKVSLVSGNYFNVLQSRPTSIGRALRPEDDVAGATPVLVLSHRAWQQRFAGDSGVVGRTITMIATGRTHTIVGVMPRGLEYPRGTDAWAPLVAYSTAGGFLDLVSLDLLGRLRPGASPADARGELTSFYRRTDAPVAQRELRGVVHPLLDIVLGDTKPALLLVSVAAALLLLITCVNVANLALVRGLGRARELAVRAALGASRQRIVGELLTESVLLAMTGGVLGIFLAVAGVRAFVALAPASVPRLDEIGVNGGALVAALLITTVAMMLSGVGPALFTARVHAQEVLRAGSRQSRGRRVRVIAEVLVVAQIALAVVSLSAAAILTRSFLNLQQAELSFEPGELLVATLAMPQDQLTNVAQQRAALDVVLANTQALPGVRGVTATISVPFVADGGGIDGRLTSAGQSAEDAAANPVLNLEVAAPNHFAMLGIPVLRGRPFQDDDREGSTPVIVVSSSVARHYWPGSDPLGKRLDMPGREFTIVGVVPDTRYRELRFARPTVYFPLRQSPFTSIVPSTLLIRTASAPTDIVPALRRAVAEAHAGVAVVSASSLESLLEAPRAEPRLTAIVIELFAAAAVMLSAIGLFAVIATMVRQRTHELGIRMALGATAGDTYRTVMIRGLGLAVVGTGIGVAGALATGGLLAALVFEIGATDAATLGMAAAMMLGVATIASIAPARMSMRIDPVIALRSDA